MTGAEKRAKAGAALFLMTSTDVVYGIRSPCDVSGRLSSVPDARGLLPGGTERPEQT